MRCIFSVCVLLVCHLEANGASQSVLYSTQASNGVNLYRIRPDTGGPTSLGSWGINGQFAYDLASDFRPGQDTLWALTNNTSNSDQTRLVRLDPATQSIVSTVPVISSVRPTTLAIDPTDGRFYTAVAGADSTLFELNPLTGALQSLGPMNANISALEFDLSGQLIAASATSLLTVNKTTGATAVLQTTPVSFRALAVRPEDGQMFGVGIATNGDYSLFQVDVDAGDVTTIGPSIFRPSGLAFIAVPEPATLTPVVIVCSALFATRRHGRRP